MAIQPVQGHGRYQGVFDRIERRITVLNRENTAWASFKVLTLHWERKLASMDCLCPILYPNHQPTPPQVTIEDAAAVRARREREIREELLPSGLRNLAVMTWTQEGEALSGFVVGYLHAPNCWSNAPYTVEGESAPQLSSLEADRGDLRLTKRAPTIDGTARGTVSGGPEGIEIPRSYYSRIDLGGKTIVMIPAMEEGFVPALHGGDHRNQNWLSTARGVSQIVMDRWGVRHPAYPGLSYRMHGFAPQEDWRGRTVWVPSGYAFIARPERAPVTYFPPTHQDTLPPPPENNRDYMEIAARGIGVVIDVVTFSHNWRVGRGTAEPRIIAERLVQQHPIQFGGLGTQLVGLFHTFRGDRSHEWQIWMNQVTEEHRLQGRQRTHTATIEETLISDQTDLERDQRIQQERERAQRDIGVAQAQQAAANARREAAQEEQRAEALRRMGRR